MTQPKRWTEKAHARPVDSSTPKPVPDGYARCDCGKVCKINVRSGRLGAHKSPKGDECAGGPGYGDPVALPPIDSIAPEAETYKRPRHRVVTRADEAYAAPKGICRRCAKWLPGERTLCGACGVKLGRS